MRSIDTDAQFVYNENGLRIQKTVNGVVTKYTLHGKNIVHMTQGGNELHFFYDAQNRPAVVVYNGTAYAYVKSLQGDIVAILDENGNTVVSYGTMRGVRRCGVPVSWRKRWARCSRLGIAGMCLMSKVANLLFENEKAVYSYLATCNGHLWKYDITADEVTLVSSDIPFDENDPYIKNRKGK